MSSSVVWPYCCSDGFLSSTWLLDSTLVISGIFGVDWPELPIFLISLSNSSFPEIHYCVCVWGGCSQLYYSLLWKWSIESKETSRFTSNVCFPLSSSDSYIQSCTVWGSFSRGLSMSRTMGLKVDSNILYKISGHALLVGKWWTCFILAFLIRTNSFSRGISPKFEFPIYKDFTLWSLETGHSLKFWI